LINLLNIKNQSMPEVRSSNLVSVNEALALLGVSRQTLYAYASRGLVRTERAPDDPRRSLYDRRDLDRLVKRRGRSRARKDVAAPTIDFGEPVLTSAITRIGDDGLFYRGQDATALAASATLEEVAGILWGGPCAVIQLSEPPPPMVPGAPVGRCLLAVAADAAAGLPTWGRSDDALLADAAHLLHRVAEAAAGLGGPGPVHALLARAWGLDPEGADIVRRALVLCADHEINPSTFAVRVVAATGAPLAACVLAGLCAVAGPLHGGAVERIRTLTVEPSAAEDPRTALAARLARGERLPGFGHHLYSAGDPRGADLLAAFRPNDPWARLIAAGEELTGRRPTVGLALVALEHRLGLPPGAALGLFAAGRVAGWIAHALEQQKEGKLIWPGARYTGP
jgi:citrate synthase